MVNGIVKQLLDLRSQLCLFLLLCFLSIAFLGSIVVVTVAVAVAIAAVVVIINAIGGGTRCSGVRINEDDVNLRIALNDKCLYTVYLLFLLDHLIAN